MSRSTVEEIKARLPIEELIGSYVKLEKAGKSFKAKCPFHNEKTASFFVSPERAGYYCFGCGAKGDIFSFVEQFEGLDFKGALRVLSEKSGVPLAADPKADSERDRLLRITEEAAQFFEAELKRAADATAYLDKRGISPETRESFRLGYAPEGWKNLVKRLRATGWNESFIEKAGLAKRGDRGELYDRFRGRIIFPITDSSGRVIAFTGRILKDDEKSAKYLNSPDTPLYSKSNVLFGLDKAKSEIRRAGYSVLVEGQMDLILSHQVGVKNAVAASGTALAPASADETGMMSNLGLVKRLSPNMIIALDSDSAGRAAAMRAVAATALSLGMSVKIADIEGGKDPADLILDDPGRWKDVLASAKHVVEFELANVISETADRHRLSRAIRERVFPFLARIESEMDKAYYVKAIAESASLSEVSVWDDLRKFQQTEKLPAGPSELKKSGNTVPGVPTHRLDLVERRMFGLLHLMESAAAPLAAEYREKIKKIAGESYPEMIRRIEPVLSDLAFEAEAFFGLESERFPMQMGELVLNYEEDLINQELLRAMGELRLAEKAGDNARVTELARISQDLSVKKSEVAKQRRG
ncbi:MAG: primase [Candidatus Parcubacteria bacterium]|jgi:DNA primase|nr:primase [Candidatus Parcubacteria bacterium]